MSTSVADQNNMKWDHLQAATVKVLACVMIVLCK